MTVPGHDDNSVPTGDGRLHILIDGDCPLCRREAALFERLDRTDRIRLVDIAKPDFDPSVYGITHAESMAEIHGRRPDGQVITGMRLFREAYAAVGLGWLLAPTGWPGVRSIFDCVYRLFARHRLRLTGRGSEATCASGACARPALPASTAPGARNDAAGASSPPPPPSQAA